MSQIKKKHIRSKTIWQIFMMFLEIAVIVGGLTLGSSLLWEFESGLDVLERMVFIKFLLISFCRI